MGHRFNGYNDRKAYMKKWYSEHPDYFKQWRKDNPDKVKAADKKWYLTHLDKAKELERNRSPRMRYKDKTVTVKTLHRTHIYSKCGKQGLTHTHHFIYHDDDVLKDTVELCPACHAKQHKIKP